MYKCIKCGKEFEEDWRRDKQQRKKSCLYCSRSCANSHNNSGPKSRGNCIICGKRTSNQKYCSKKCLLIDRDAHKRSLLNEWLNNDLSHCLYESGVNRYELRGTVKIIIKDYLLEQQDHKCSICNISDNWNNQKLVFILDHIDGNWRNNYKDNFRLICPNCNSQLSTTGSKNTGKGRFSTKYYRIDHRNKLNNISI